MKMLTLPYFSRMLINAFVFFGVIGNLIPFMSISKAFRFYYTLLPIIILYFILKKNNRIILKYAITCLPLFLYFLASAVFAYFSDDILDMGTASSTEQNPLIRLLLLYCLFLATVALASCADAMDIKHKFDIILLYLRGFFITAIVGFIFFIGFYRGSISLGFISQFQVLVQFGAGGLLRMSPGSYPNEYGTVASFSLSILTLLFFNKQQLRKEGVMFVSRINVIYYTIFWIVSIIALFLSTTRSAYISYVVSFFYINFSQGKVKNILKSALCFSIIFVCVQLYVYDVSSIFVSAYNSIYTSNGSAAARWQAWMEGWKYFRQNLMFGMGFGKYSISHNTYLQLLFECGISGVAIFFLTFVLMRDMYSSKKNTIDDSATILHEIFLKIRRIAVWHVLWFAMSNHNLNHHLTWFCVLLIFLSNYRLKSSSSQREFYVSKDII